jgi:zinc transport system substrate-binding protein
MKYYNITFCRFWGVLLFGFCSITSGALGQERLKPVVVTSIKPLAMIAKSALQDSATVEFIMPPALSPHDYVLKLSDIRKLASADAVFWIGPEFEIRAAKQLLAIPEKKRLTALNILNMSADGAFKDNHDGQLTDNHHENGVDPHIWLSPVLANQLAAKLLSHFGLPVKEIFSSANRKVLEDLLAPVKNKSYIVHHQGIGHFIDEFKLKPALSIRDMLGKQQGAKTQYNLRLEGEKNAVSCVFIEPQHGDKDAKAIAKDLSIPTTSIDILAVASGDQLPSYESYINGLAKQFINCFQ